jgi:hypothetical protein
MNEHAGGGDPLSGTPPTWGRRLMMFFVARRLLADVRPLGQ